MTPFAPLFVPEELRESVSGRAWLEAMLEFESALATAEAAVGVLPVEAAVAIAERCRGELFDFDDLLERGRRSGNPAEPLAQALRDEVGGEAATYVHWGATSQDVMDTASMIVARRALGLVLGELDRVTAGLAALADTHRSTPMAARTLLQQAVPTTFGLKTAGWLVAVLEVRTRLEELRARRLAAQLGGAGGTLAALGEQGADVLRALSAQLELREPDLPWHTNRTRIAELGGALDTCAGVLAKIALDLALLAQTEVGEVREGSDGGSSTMPQKRNPVGSTLARACAYSVSGHASVLSRAVVQEHERAAGSWHAEWEALSGALAYTGGAAAATAGAIEGLEVDTDRMRHNLDAAGGTILAERVSFALAGQLGREEATALVREAARRSAAAGRDFGEELRADHRMELSEEELREVLDPETYLGSAEVFVDRALALYRSRERDGT
jgi:3-carboxy-cis,cis-muconate cycloisomerase